MNAKFVSTSSRGLVQLEIDQKKYSVDGLLPNQILVKELSPSAINTPFSFKLYTNEACSGIEGEGEFVPISKDQVTNIRFTSLNKLNEANYHSFYATQLKQICASDIMQPQPKTILQTEPISAAVDLMNQFRIGSIVVTEPNGEIIGILTERDLLTKFHKISGNDAISKHMTAGITTILEDQQIDEIYQRFQSVSFRHFPVVDKNSKLIGMISMRDILKYWNLIIEVDRDNAKKKYDRAMSVIVHDLRSPIYAIKSINDLLVNHLTSVEDYMEDKYPPIIEETCDSMAALIDELLDLATTAHGSMTLKILPTDLNKLIEKVVAMFGPSANAKKIELLYHGVSSKPTYSVDPQRIVEIFQNLISNGLKYSAPGSTVMINLTECSAGVTIEVADSGQGIPEKELPNVFDEMAKISSRPTANEASTGLGLSITKKMVEAHGGNISVHSQLKKGTTFRLFLPNSSTELKKSA